MKYRLNGKTVIVTGAGGGLGFALVKRLIEGYNCRVIGVGRTEEKLREAKARLTGGSFDYMAFDVTDRGKWDDFVAFLEEKGIVPDLLINNAGCMLPFEHMDKYTDGDIDGIIATNLVAYITAIRKMLPLLKKAPAPAIVNICSAGGICAVAGQSLYSATKFAVRGFTNAIRSEYPGFYIGGVYPGFIRTDIMRRQKLNASEKTLIDKFMLPADTAAKRICRGISYGKKSRVIGVDGHLMSVFGRAFPTASSAAVAWVLRTSRLDMFADVFD